MKNREDEVLRAFDVLDHPRRITASNPVLPTKKEHRVYGALLFLTLSSIFLYTTTVVIIIIRYHFAYNAYSQLILGIKMGIKHEKGSVSFQEIKL